MKQNQQFARLSNLPLPSPDQVGWPWTEESSQIPESMPDGSSWPRISIVTPSYNQGQFIEETIRSVLLQGYPNLEYIIIDGGSTDGSVEIVKKYESWLTYWTSESDRGQSHAINKGFEHATGNIMAWINSDDIYTIGSLANVAQALSKTQKSMLVGSAIYLSADSQVNGKVDSRRPTYEELLYEGHSFPQPSVFWTNDLWPCAGPINEGLYYIMDFDLWLRMCRISNPVKFTERIFSCERIHPDQKTWIKSLAQHELSNRQKSKAVLNAVGLLWMPIWLIRSYFRRVLAAIRARNPYLLKISGFQKFVIQEIMAMLFVKGKHLENI